MWSRNTRRRVISLLNNVLRKPALANCISSLEFSSDNSLDWLHEEHIPISIPVDGFNLSLAVQTISGSGLPFIQQWIQQLFGGEGDAFLALLLLKLHGLKHLVISTRYFTSEVLSLFLRAALCVPGTCGPAAFQNLSEVTYKIRGRYRRLATQYRCVCGQGAADTLPFFCLSSITRLSISLDNPESLDWPILSTSNPSMLTSLDLHLVRESHLLGLLSMTPKLKYLKWTLFFCDTRRRKHPIQPTNTLLVELDKVSAALEQVRDTLQDLEIAVEVQHIESYLEAPNLRLNGTLRSLTTLPRLTVLKIPPEFLFASLSIESALPLKLVVPNHIETLVLTDDLADQEFDEWDGWALYDSISDWLQDGAATNSALRDIQFTLVGDPENPFYMDWPLDARQQLGYLAHEYGVKAEVLFGSSGYYGKDI
ncbi:hypothetical protein BT63DRAFT_479528 [Microthyrium microscopicum]|uniref:F-box domain-containing protein n=1 Tax=Microthyrium microscopicum TaxID=703497 RepID=A0A6A6UFT1_9PEZI|nr:hypothetical protein BT63DRAFT_479528 [Microthyrium microscopicum]